MPLNNPSATFSNSAGLAALLSDETGTGAAVFGSGPTFHDTFHQESADLTRTVDFAWGVIAASHSYEIDANNGPLILKGSTAIQFYSNGLQVTFDNGVNTFLGSVAIGGGTPIAKVLSATGTLNFGSTAAGTSADLTITVTGAALGDVVAVGVPNGSVNANACFTAFVSAANTVTVRFNNYSSGAIDPASGTFRVTLTQF